MSNRRPWQYFPDDDATEAQQDKILDLLVQYDHLECDVKLEDLSKEQASKLIQDLLRKGKGHVVEMTPSDDGSPATEAQWRMLNRLFAVHQISTKTTRLALVGECDVDTLDLTKVQARRVIKHILEEYETKAS